MKKSLSRLKHITVVIALLLGMVGLPLMVPQMAGAQASEKALCEGSGGTWSGSKCTNGSRTVTGTLQQVINIIIFVVGAISVIMIVIGGLRYTLSGGDSNSTKGAKDTILYAIIGVVVAFAAYAIVNFVLDNIGA